MEDTGVQIRNEVDISSALLELTVIITSLKWADQVMSPFSRWKNKGSARLGDLPTSLWQVGT